ncbi:MAG: hypothetical protein JO287_05980 [Pseudonocardiales bacterium]|nr:hypothetical protein [Pseudonocardiales bacterium]
MRLIADLTGGAAPSIGFVHGMLGRCAALLGEVVTLIKTAVTLAAVAGFDETVIRCGPAGRKKYVLSGSTETAVAYHLGGRDLGSFAAFGILPSFAGICGARPLRVLLPPGLDAAGRAPGLPGLLDPRLRGRRVLAGCGLAGPGAASVARPDPCLARCPRAGVGRNPRRSARGAVANSGR